MNTWDDKHPRPVTPLRDLLLGCLGAGIILAIGLTCGWIMGQEKAWQDQAELSQAVETANTQLAEAAEFHERIQPWLWVEGCNPKPAVDVFRLDESRRLVTLACNPAIVIPEVGVER